MVEIEKPRITVWISLRILPTASMLWNLWSVDMA